MIKKILLSVMLIAGFGFSGDGWISYSDTTHNENIDSHFYNIRLEKYKSKLNDSVRLRIYKNGIFCSDLIQTTIISEGFLNQRYYFVDTCDNKYKIIQMSHFTIDLSSFKIYRKWVWLFNKNIPNKLQYENYDTIEISQNGSVNIFGRHGNGRDSTFLNGFVNNTYHTQDGWIPYSVKIGLGVEIIKDFRNFKSDEVRPYIVKTNCFLGMFNCDSKYTNENTIK